MIVLPPLSTDRGYPRYEFPDGSAIWQTPGDLCWKAHWPDRVMLRGEDPRTGMEVDWRFDSPEQAAAALVQEGCP